MEKKFDILNKIIVVYEKSKYSKLNNNIFSRLDTELKQLASYFHLNETEAFIFAIIFALNYKNADSVNIIEISNHFKCSPMELLKYSHIFNNLSEKGYINEDKDLVANELIFANDAYIVDTDISRNIINDKEINQSKNESVTKLVDFLEKVNQLYEKKVDDKINDHTLRRKFKTLLFQNQHLNFIEKMNQFYITERHLFIFYYLIWDNLTGSDETYIESVLKNIIDQPSTRIHIIQDFNNEEENELVINDLIEIEPAHFINDSVMKLGVRSLEMLEAEGIKLFDRYKKNKNSDVILPSDINGMELFFSKNEKSQLNLIQKALKPPKFKALQDRLRSRSLPEGVTILLYGAPGTGKTESVLQIAKKTGREIIKVDISQTKSMWYGESEKKIKEIFTKYEKYSKKSAKTPILFFNEADAILSIRRNNLESNVSQTENTIQNILLEELENFKGIFMATTNLAENLDPAFERRFLFKVKFHKPSTEIRTKIWQSKLKTLSLRNCRLLAESYDFSGGQINNIVRKSEIAEVVHGKKLSIELIMKFCEEENFSFDKNRNKIGFGR